MVDKCEEDGCKTGTLIDFVTGLEIADTTMERLRQKTERFLVENKGYSKDEIKVTKKSKNALEGKGITADLIVKVDGKKIIIIKCTCGSLMSGERLVVSYARLFDSYQIPFAVVTNGDDTDVLDTRSGKVIGSGLDAIPAKDDLNITKIEFTKLPEEKLVREKRVLAAFESIDETMCSNIGK